MDEANSRNFPPPPPTEEELEIRQRQEFVETHQFPREDLLLQEKLGEGEYGPIYRLVYIYIGLVPRAHSSFSMSAVCNIEKLGWAWRQDYIQVYIGLLMCYRPLFQLGLIPEFIRIPIPFPMPVFKAWQLSLFTAVGI